MSQTTDNLIERAISSNCSSEPVTAPTVPACIACSGFLEKSANNLFDIPFGIAGEWKARHCPQCGLEQPTFVGRLARLPLSLVPRKTVMPILAGPLRGRRWIAGSGIHRLWLGLYERDKQELISRSVKPNTTFYDVGANAGFYTLLGSVLVGDGNVFAFEPVTQNLRYLRQHLVLNHFQNVEVLEIAVSDKNGSALFEIEQTGSMGRLSDGGTVTVQTTTLDSLLEQGKILPPNYIKMDIEGGELAALRGAEKCIRKYRPQIFLATHGQEIHSQCYQLLESWGFECQLFELTSDWFGEVVARPRP